MSETWTDIEDDDLSYYLGLHQLRLLDCNEIPPWQPQLRNYAENILPLTKHLSARHANVSVHFAPLSSPLFNGRAFAHVSNGHEYRFATVTAGALMYLHSFFHYIMSRNDILSNIGIAVGEPNIPFKFSPPQTWPPLAELLAKKLIKTNIPKCPIRRNFAGAMVAAATGYLICHEIGHCVNGHVGFSHHHLDEVDSRITQDASATLTKHTLEMDADAFATSRFFDFALGSLLANNIFGWSNEAIREAAMNLLYPGLIAVQLLFRIIARPERLAEDPETWLSGTHPHPLIRSQMFRATCATIAIGRGMNEGGSSWVAELTVQSALNVRRIWESVTGLSEPLKMVALHDDPKLGYERGADYARKLRNRWKTLHNELVNLAIVDLTIPDA